MVFLLTRVRQISPEDRDFIELPYGVFHAIRLPIQEVVTHDVIVHKPNQPALHMKPVVFIGLRVAFQVFPFDVKELNAGTGGAVTSCFLAVDVTLPTFHLSTKINEVSEQDTQKREVHR